MTTAREPPVLLALGGSVLLVLGIAYLDFATGVELRVFPLYFLPVLVVSLRLGRWAGLVASTACAGVWLLANRLAGMHEGRPELVVANGVVMAAAFGAVALLGATQRTWLERERAISRTDSLTGLLNTRGFYEAAATELGRASRYRHPITVAYLDLDDFKEVNDRLGHARGDAVLVAAAHALRRGCRSSDLVARLGGDEFALLFPETGREASEAALAKLRSAVREATARVGGAVSASAGSVSFARPPGEVEALVHEADAVMYAVKRDGKNALRCVSYGENQ